MAETGPAGAFIGSFLTSYVPIAVLLLIIGLIVLYESFALLRGSRIKKQKHDDINSSKIDETTDNDRILTLSKNRLVLLEPIIGFGVGFLGGLIGLVLGSIRMPAMISILKMESRIAIGTNLASASVMGVSGLIGHIVNNNIDYLVLMVMGSAAMIGGYLGARYTNRFSDTSLKRIIGIVLNRCRYYNVFKSISINHIVEFVYYHLYCFNLSQRFYFCASNALSSLS